MNLIQYILVCIFYVVSKIVGIRFSSILGGTLMYTFGFFSKKNLIGINNLGIAFPKKL